MDDTTPDAPLIVPAGMEALADLFGKAVAAGLRQDKKKSFGEYARKHARTVKLTRTCWECGFRLEDHALSDEEITLLNRIDRSGLYINKMVSVSVRENNGQEEVALDWSCKTPDQRNELKGEAKNLTEILKRIIAAQEAEDRAEADAPPKRRPFGTKKATREAYEAAGAPTPGLGL